MLVRIVGPDFVVGVIIERGRVVRAAPIVAYMIGWTGPRVSMYVAKRGWSRAIVSTPELGLMHDDGRQPTFLR